MSEGGKKKGKKYGQSTSRRLVKEQKQIRFSGELIADRETLTVAREFMVTSP